jgi:hypothetical protein
MHQRRKHVQCNIGKVRNSQHIFEVKTPQCGKVTGSQKASHNKDLLAQGLRQVGVTLEHQARGERIEFTRVLIRIVKDDVA